MNPVHIRRIRRAIFDRFDGLIGMSDRTWPTEEDRDQAFLSRGLAALAIQIESSCSEEQAASAVFDGYGDGGLDAIAAEQRGNHAHLAIVQAKWSDKGKAGFGETEASKLLHGLNKILDLQFDDFNVRLQRHAEAIEAVLDSASPRITLVIALMTETPLHENIRRRLDEEMSNLNYAQEMVSYKVLDVRDFHREILGAHGEPKIQIKARLEGFGRESGPIDAFYGTMDAPDVAAWYEAHGRGLFAKNIRDSLDSSDVNVRIRKTLIEEPDHFWYFSNGITVLCDSIKKSGQGAARLGGTGHFILDGASVVNGAQTVSAMHKALKANSEAASQGRVLVRLISLEGSPENFGKQVTVNTNTQNPIEDRDFKSLHPVQRRLRDDFALDLSLTYVTKRGEKLPDPERGCDMVEAATALACANPDPTLSAVAKRDAALLWDEGIYNQLFGDVPEAQTVWRSVQLLREVRKSLAGLAEGLLGRALMAAKAGDLLVTHLVYRRLDAREIGNPNADWDVQLRRVPGLVEMALGWLVRSIDREFGSSSHVIAAVRNDWKIARVARHALEGLASGRPSPLSPDFVAAAVEERSRKANAVPVLVAARCIEEGAALQFRPISGPERREMAEWLAAEPQRAQATWTNKSPKCLIWSADGLAYSPTGLVKHMRYLASGKRQQAQGTQNWYVPGKGSLVALAAQLRAEGDVAAEVEEEQD